MMDRLQLFGEADGLPVNEPVPALIPVTIEANEEPATPAAPPASPAPLCATSSHASPPAVLKLEFRHCCVTIEGCPDAQLLRTVLGCLSR